MSADQIVIVTRQDDPHADDVIRALLAMGHEPIRLNTDELPLEASLSLAFESRWAGHVDLHSGGRRIDVDRIRSVWWRRPGPYRSGEYTHELVAEIYAMLMSRRRRGHTGQPAWLDDEIYELVRGGADERVEPPKGHILTSKDAVKEILAVEAELLRSEGIDPAWPGFAETTEEPESSE